MRGPLLQRILSGAVGLAIFLVLCFSGLETFVVAVIAIAALAITEYRNGWLRIAGTDGCPRRGARSRQAYLWLGLAAPAAAYALIRFTRRSDADVLDAAAITIAAITAVLSGVAFGAMRRGRLSPVLRSHYGLIGLAYIGPLISSLVLLRALPGAIRLPALPWATRGMWLMLLTAACVWATDTGAFMIGRAFGRRKLAPLLSPGKTVEGAIGGLIGGVAAGVALGPLVHVPAAHGLAMGLIAGCAGQIGDLFESALKREAGVKDFGRIMPGHGGVLDRFDSLLFAAPLAYLYFRLVLTM